MKSYLEKFSIEDKIAKIIHKNPISVNSKVEKNKVLVLMQEHELQHIPIVDELGKPIGLYIVD